MFHPDTTQSNIIETSCHKQAPGSKSGLLSGDFFTKILLFILFRAATFIIVNWLTTFPGLYERDNFIFRIDYSTGSIYCIAKVERLQLIDARATTETKNLFKNLISIAAIRIPFENQYATEYGHGWQGDENRSDVESPSN